jgi:hypothetical protein
MAAASKSRQLLFLVGVYAALPSALITALLIGWVVAVENATIVLQSADSPDGRYRAEVVREDPGASSNYEFMVRITPANLTPLAQKLRLLPFGPQYTALDAHREPDKLAVRWNGATTLTIHCEGCNDTPRGKPRWRDIQLNYELK